jgi:hypothetical protein
MAIAAFLVWVYVNVQSGFADINTRQISHDENELD